MSALNANQRKALMALLSCSSFAAAARLAGLNERTIRRYLKDDVFKAALTELRDDVMRAAILARATLYGRGIQELLDLLDNEKTSLNLRFRVADKAMEPLPGSQAGSEGDVDVLEARRLASLVRVQSARSDDDG